LGKARKSGQPNHDKVSGVKLGKGARLKTAPVRREPTQSYRN